MPAATFETIQRDKLAMSVARALAAANEAAAEHGIDVPASLVTITEEPAPAGRAWRIHYGPRDYIARRGGDLSVIVDDRSGSIERIIHGQ